MQSRRVRAGGSGRQQAARQGTRQRRRSHTTTCMPRTSRRASVTSPRFAHAYARRNLSRLTSLLGDMRAMIAVIGLALFAEVGWSSPVGRYHVEFCGSYRRALSSNARIISPKIIAFLPKFPGRDGMLHSTSKSLFDNASRLDNVAPTSYMQATISPPAHNGEALVFNVAFQRCRRGRHAEFLHARFTPILMILDFGHRFML